MKPQKNQVEIEGITRKDGELAIEFVKFLEYHEQSASSNNIYLNCATFCAYHKYTENKVTRLFDLVHMYVHKILRHKPKY